MKFNKFFDAFPPPKFLNVPFAGLSISDSSVRCIQFGRKKGSFYIEKYAEKTIPPGVVNSGHINNSDELVNILDSLKKELGLNDIKLAISEENAYLFTAKIPTVEESEIVSAIESKIEENVPVAPAELIFDYMVSNHKEKEHLDVVVYAVPIKVVDSYIEVISKAGLNIISFEIESQDISRALLKPNDLETVLIVNFNQGKVGLYVIRKSIVRFSSTIPLKGDEGSIPGILLQEIKKLYMYWHTLKENIDEPENKIERIIICGGSEDSNVIPFLSTHLDTKVVLGNVWTNVFDINKIVPQISFADSFKYAASVGLALSRDISI